MLFDVHADPMELTNLADSPKYQQTRESCHCPDVTIRSGYSPNGEPTIEPHPWK